MSPELEEEPESDEELEEEEEEDDDEESELDDPLEEDDEGAEGADDGGESGTGTMNRSDARTRTLGRGIAAISAASMNRRQESRRSANAGVAMGDVRVEVGATPPR